MATNLKSVAAPRRPEDIFGIPHKSKPWCSYLDITPSMAAELLAFNTANRPGGHKGDLTPEDFTALMDASKFKTTHQGIAFDRDGTLVDGQTRLAGCAASQTAINMNVSFGMPQGSYWDVDRQRRRTIAHNLHTANILTGPASTSLETASRLLWHYDADRLPWDEQPLFQPRDTEQVLAQHPELPAWADDCYHHRGKRKFALPPGPTAAFATLFQEVEREPGDARAFILGVRNGADLPERDPRHVMRGYLGGNMASAAEWQAYMIRLVRAWNHHYARSLTSTLNGKLRDGRFPEVAGYKRPE